jgi:predicted aconitase with swiveling domain/8-oxo-dGTP pyrophosphatase MutT (NUDIX family)
VIIQGRSISKGRGAGRVLLNSHPVSFLGGVDPISGSLTDPSSCGRTVRDQVLAFPRGKGSTVGSYVLLELRRNGTLPAAMINTMAEPIVATGAVMAKVPLVDRIDIALLMDGDAAVVDGTAGTVELPEVGEKHVVSCVLQDGEKLLLLKRSEKVGTFRGYWASVSGFIEEGETPRQTACKELLEETGLDLPYVKEGEVRTVRDHDTIWHIHPFLFRAIAPKVQTDWEHTEFCWVRPDEMGTFRTVPGLVEMVRDLL